MPLSSSSSLLEYTTTNIPAFLTKLWTLVEDEKNSELIAWDQSGFSFHVYDQTRFAREILPRYFKHNNMASFIRQLNMYGFRKVNSIDHGSLRNEKEDLEFHHPYFIKDKEQFLEYIKRKVSDIKQQQVQAQSASPAISHNQQALLQQSNLQQLQSSQQQQNQLTCNPGSQSLQSIQVYPQIKLDEINKVLDEVSVIKSKQKMVDETLYSIKKENEALWKEVASLRQKHHHQQQIVNKLIHFLVHLANPVYMSNLKRAKPLMIDHQASSLNSAGPAGNGGVGSVGGSSSSHLVELDEDNAIFNEEDLDSVNEVLSPSSYMNNNMEVIDKNDLYQAYLADDTAEVETINNAKNSVPAPSSASGDSGTLRAMPDHLPTKIRLGNLSMSSKPVVKRLKTADLNLSVGNKNLFRSPNYQIVNPKAIALNNYNTNMSTNTNSNSSTNLNTIMSTNINAADTGTASEALDSSGLFIGDAAIGLVGSPLANNTATATSTSTTTNSPIISMPASPNLISSNLNRNNIMMISEAHNSNNNESSGESLSSKGALQPVQLAVREKTQNDAAPTENNQSLKRTLSSNSTKSSTEMNDQIESLQIDLNSIKDFLTSNVYNQQDTYSTINQLFSNNSIGLDQIEQGQIYIDAPTDISIQDQIADNIVSSSYNSQNGSSKVIDDRSIQEKYF